MNMSFDEFRQSYVVHKMGEQETVNAFDCGDEDLNGFILTDAPSDFDNKTKYNRFSRRFNNHKRLKSYPAAKIGRLAVHSSVKGKNIGSTLLDFIKRYFTADNKTGCRFITVDAYAAAIPFYLRNGFVPLNDEDIDEPTRLLYFDLNDLDED